jgi:hypothetical protein
MTTPAPGPLPADVAAQLAQLRDIHLPGPVSWWPLAPGWWALALLVVACCTALIVYELRRRRSLKHQALQELMQLRKDRAPQLDGHELASELCVLIRRVVLNTAGGRQYASAHGDAWSMFLAASPNGMPEEIARFIAVAPYTAHAAANDSPGNPGPDHEALVSAAENWIRRHA